MDLEPCCLDVIKASSIDTMLSDSLDAFDESGAGNNWVKGHYTRGAELIGEVVDAIRKEAESMGLSTRFSNYIVIWRWYRWRSHALLLLKISNNYAHSIILIIATFSVYPSP